MIRLFGFFAMQVKIAAPTLGITGKKHGTSVVTGIELRHIGVSHASQVTLTGSANPFSVPALIKLCDSALSTYK